MLMTPLPPPIPTKYYLLPSSRSKVVDLSKILSLHYFKENLYTAFSIVLSKKMNSTFDMPAFRPLHCLDLVPVWT